MKSFSGRILSAFGVLSLALLMAGTVACGKGALERGLTGPPPDNPQELMAELQEQKEAIDKASDGMMKRIEQFNATRGPDEKKIQFSEIFYSDLNPEQRDVLEQLLQEERTPTYRNLLGKIIEDRNTIKSLQERVLRLEQQLDDKFVIAQRGDTHYKLAHDFLISQGVTEDQAKDLLNQIDLNEELMPGFKVWYNYNAENGSFKTYVTQGEAGQTPLAVKRAVRRKLVEERDVAHARATALEQTKKTLQSDISRLETDISGLEDRRSNLEVQVADLEARNNNLQVRGDKLEEDLTFRQNSLFYHVNSQKALADQGILTRFLKNLKDVKGVSFDESLDLRQAKSITVTPEPYGLRKITSVEIWPSMYQEGRDYTIQVSEDGHSATVLINDPNVFRQQRVVIAVRGDQIPG